MKVLVIDRYPDLAEEFQAMCAESDLEALRDLKIEYAKDTNVYRMNTFEEYVQRMEKEGPEWMEPDQEVLDKIQDADILLIQWGAVSSAVIEMGKKLKVLHWNY